MCWICVFSLICAGGRKQHFIHTGYVLVRGFLINNYMINNFRKCPKICAGHVLYSCFYTRCICARHFADMWWLCVGYMLVRCFLIFSESDRRYVLGMCYIRVLYVLDMCHAFRWYVLVMCWLWPFNRCFQNSREIRVEYVFCRSSSSYLDRILFVMLTCWVTVRYVFNIFCACGLSPACYSISPRFDDQSCVVGCPRC